METVTRFASLENVADLGYTHYYKDYARRDHHEATYIGIIYFVVIYSVFCLLGIIGNGVVIWFGFFRMKKTVNVVWFLSLAIADFFFALMNILLLVQLFLNIWLGIWYKLMVLLLALNALVSALQLTVISVDRCICVMFPVWCHNHRRPILAFIIALIIWIMSFLLVTPFRYPNLINNTEILRSTSIYEYMAVFGFAFFLLQPFIIIVSCYIVIVLRMRRRRIFISSKPFKTMVAVIIAFFICWFPGHVIFLLNIFRPTNIHFHVLSYAVLFAYLMIILNSCINPILYVFIGRDFNEKCCGSFQASLKKAFIEEEEKADCENQGGNIAPTSAKTDDNEEVIQ